MITIKFNKEYGGYTSKRNMQAILLWRHRRTKPFDKSWGTTPSRAYKVKSGVMVYKWNRAMGMWLEDAYIVWED